MSPQLLKRLDCLVSGHEDMVHCSPCHVFLRCERCGRETLGWHLDDAPETWLPQTPGANTETVAWNATGTGVVHTAVHHDETTATAA